MCYKLHVSSTLTNLSDLLESAGSGSLQVNVGSKGSSRSSYGSSRRYSGSRYGGSSSKYRSPSRVPSAGRTFPSSR